MGIVPKKWTLAARFSGLAILLIVLTVGGLGLVFYFTQQAQIEHTYFAEMRATLNADRSHLLEIVNDYTRDLQFLSRTPPIQGIIRALDKEGYDPVDKSGLQQWKERLQVIFYHLLVNKPYFLQARYIGKAGNGRELVRVHWEGEQIKIVPENELQSKGDRDYLRSTLGLLPGQVYISEFNLNREHGVISQPHTPTFRIGVPIFKEDGTVFGAVLLNASTELLEKVYSKRKYTSWVTNSSGDFIFHPDSSKTFGFDLGKRYRIQDQFPSLGSFYSNPNRQSIFLKSDLPDFEYIFAEKYNLIQGKYPRSIVQVIGLPTNGPVREFSLPLNPAIWFSLLMILVGALLAVLFARRLTGSIQEIRDQIGKYVKTGSWEPLPLNSKDEFQDLCQACNEFVEKISTHQQALLESNQKLAEESKNRERMNLELKNLNSKMAKKNQELDRFAYVTSHDLKAPLRGIASLVEWIEQDLGDELSGKVRDHLARMKGRVQRLQAMISGILDYSRASQTPGDRQEMDLSKELPELVQFMAVAEGFQIHLPHELPVIEGERIKVQQVFQNLMQNAISHHDQEEGNVWVSCTSADDFYEFRIEDDGPGIPDKFRDRVFEMFQRLEARDKKEGTGVGLAIVKKIIEEEGGRIWIEDRKPRGAIFCFTWAQMETPQSPQARKEGVSCEI